MPSISGDVEVRQQSPGSVARPSRFSLTQISHLDPFIVTATTDPAQQRVVFELFLTEWLPELKLFLDDAAALQRDRLLLFSGDRFRASRSSHGISIEVYDVQERATISLQLDAASSATFFQRLRSSLLKAIKDTDGNTVEPEDVSRITLPL